MLGDAAQQQPSSATAVMVAADDHIEAMLVGVLRERPCRRLAVDDVVLDAYPGSLRAVGDLPEGFLEVAVRGIRGLPAVSGGFGVSG